MKKSFRKTIVIAVAAIMTLSLTVFQSGCGSKNNNNAAGASTAAGSTAGNQTAASEQPVTLKILAPNFSVPTQGEQTDPVVQEVKKRTGVIMDITSANASGDVVAKTSAMIASNDLPDLIFLQSPDLMRAAITAKVLLPMDDYLQKYGQNLLKNAPKMLDYSRNVLAVDSQGKTDGKLYLLCPMVGNFDYGPIYADGSISLRWDLYKKSGYPQINTLEDLIPAMKKMLEFEPTNKDGKKNYGIGWYFGDAQWSGDWAIWAGTMLYGQVPADNFSMTSAAPDNGEFVHYITDPGSSYFKLIRFFNKAYQAGLLDPDSFTMKQANYDDKFKAGRYMMSVRYNDAYNKVLKSQGITDEGFVQMPPPGDSTAYLLSWRLDQGNGSNAWAISGNCKYPEKAVALLDYMASIEGSETFLNGVKGIHWDEVDGKPVFKQGIIERFITDPTLAPKEGIQKYSFFNILSGLNTDLKYNSYLNFFSNPEVAASRLTPLDKDECDYYKVKVPLDLITNKFKNFVAYWPEQQLMSKPPKDMIDQAAKIDLYHFNNYAKMILAKTDEQFNAEQDKFIKGVQSLGYDNIVKWYNEERQRVLAKMK